MKKLWHDKAWADYIAWPILDRKKFKKINTLIENIERNGYHCMGLPEPLRGDLSGWWSVRIDQENRIIFRINGDVLTIYSCAGHYEN